MDENGQENGVVGNHFRLVDLLLEFGTKRTLRLCP